MAVDPAVVGDWIAGIAAAAGAAATWFAWRALRKAKAIDARDLRPRIYCEFAHPATPDGAGRLAVVLRNGGGYAQWHRIVVEAGNGVYFSTAQPMNRDEVRPEALQQLYQSGAGRADPKVLIHIARDAEDGWWDLIHGRRIRQDVQSWLRTQSAALRFPQAFQLSPAEIAKAR